MSAASFDVSDVSGAMGAREGTAPEDDPLMRSQSARARTEGCALGHREGRAEGHREGVARGQLNAVAQILEARGVAVALDTAEDRGLVAAVPGDALVAAALSCTDAADFRRRLGEQGAGGPGSKGRTTRA